MKIINCQSTHAVDLRPWRPAIRLLLASGILTIAIALSGCSGTLEDAAAPTAAQTSEANTEEPISTPSIDVAPTTTESIAPDEEEPTTQPIEDPIQPPKLFSGDEIYELTFRSVPLIKTPTGEGAGILVDDGYVISNYHTVWPFGAAQVVFPEGPNLAEVPVVGWIPSADLAVLGPVKVSLQGLTLADGEGLGPGSELFMVGYSAERNLLPEVSITRGVLSRFREWESLGITYLQSDTIASANIDGALLNDHGEVVGISALSFSDASLGLVSSAADIAALVDELIRDARSAIQDESRVELDQASREHKVSLSSRWDTAEFAFEASAGSLVEFWIDGTEDGLFRVFSPTDLLIEVDKRLYGRESARVEIPSTGIYFFQVQLFGFANQANFTVGSSIPTAPLRDPDDGRTIEVGETPSTTTGVIDYVGDIDWYTIELDKGESIAVETDSATVDTIVSVDYLLAGGSHGTRAGRVITDDNSGSAFLGEPTNSRVVYRAPDAGNYFIAVADAQRDGYGGYFLSVAPASAAVEAETPEAIIPQPVGPVTSTLKILHSGDGESKLLPDDEDNFPGVARFAAQMKLIQEAAADRSSDVITLTSGGTLSASQELNVSLSAKGAFYDSIALSGLYDAMTLGNHDFDLGPDVTARFIEGFDPPVKILAANADFSGEPNLQALVDSGVLVASTVVEAGEQKVGVIGAITPMLPNISSPRNVVVSDVLAAVQAEVRSLGTYGVNKVILVSHLQGLSEEIALVADLAGVDVVIAGGSGELLRNDGDTCMSGNEPVGPYPLLVKDSTGTDVPVITVPSGYRCIGELTVVFDSRGSIVSHTGRSVGVSMAVIPDPTVQSTVIEPLAAAVTEADAQVIGHSDVELDGRRSGVLTSATNLGNLHSDALRYVATDRAASFGLSVPDVAIQNGGSIRNNAVIPTGPITVGDTWRIAPFRGFVVVGKVSRETFHVLLEQAVTGIPDASGQFPQISGFTFTYDPSAATRGTDWAGDCPPASALGSRIRDVTLDDGTVIVRDGTVVPGDPIVLATLDLLANGGYCYPLESIEFKSVGVTSQQALADYIAEDLKGTITAASVSEAGGNRIVALKPKPKMVKVKRGDTLSEIALRHLGSVRRWPEIYELNRDRVQSDGRRLTKPTALRAGWVLELPPR